MSVNASGGQALDVLGTVMHRLGTLLIFSAPQTRLVCDDSEFWLQARLVLRVVSQLPSRGQSSVHAASV